MTATRLPLRSEVPAEHTWDLSSLFRTDAEWEAAFAEWEKQADGYGKFRGKLGDGPAVVAECLRFDTAFDRAGDRVGTYAFLGNGGRGERHLPGDESPLPGRGGAGDGGGKLHPS